MTIEPGQGIRTPGLVPAPATEGAPPTPGREAEEVGVDVDDDFDRSLRPPTLEDFVGQSQVTDQLGIFIEAARRREEPLDHVLLAGPPGLGKTSLAYIIA